jgi:CarD family transcriptional regulator
MQYTFRIGDKAVYPAQGVAEISGIETKDIGGTQQIFYVLTVVETDKRILVPVKKAATCGMRHLMTPDDVDHVYRIVSEEEPVIEQQTWNRRYRKYLEMIKTGSADDLARVIRDLNALRRTKPLSFGEKKIIETAIDLLVREISLVKEAPEVDILREFKALLDQRTAETGPPAADAAQ